MEMCLSLSSRDLSGPPGEAGWVAVWPQFLTCTPTGRFCVGVRMCVVGVSMHVHMRASTWTWLPYMNSILIFSGIFVCFVVVIFEGRVSLCNCLNCPGT